jgi:uncharacterized protein (TIGR02145 family)
MMNSLSKSLIFYLLTLISASALAQEYGSFTDERDGTTYKTVEIGQETWMAENIKYINSEITCGVDTKHGASMKNHGCLYSFTDAQRVCPIGWHLPTKVEFDRLLINVGEGREGSNNLRDVSWQAAPNGSGFSAKAAGSYSSGGYFGFGSSAYFWSATECDNEGINAYAMVLREEKVSSKSCHSQITDALAVRCVKDSGNTPKAHLFTDERDGSTYKTVKIAGKTWMAENIKYLAPGIDYKAASKPDEYGYLYNWEDAQKVCPSGWHLPTKMDFDRLLTHVGKGVKGADNLRHKNFENGKNLSGFGALPAGSCAKGRCAFFDTEAYFWSSTERGKNQAFGLYIDLGKTAENSGKKASYLSVRCIQNGENEEKELAAIAAIKAQETNKRYLVSSIAVGAAAGGAGVISGAILLSLAASYAKKTLDGQDKLAGIHQGKAATGQLMTQRETADLARKGQALEVSSYVAFGVAGAAVVTAVALGIKYNKGKKVIKNTQVTVAPAVNDQMAQITIGGRF